MLAIAPSNTGAAQGNPIIAHVVAGSASVGFMARIGSIDPAMRDVAPCGIGLRATRISGGGVRIDTAAHSVNPVSPGGGPVSAIEVMDPALVAALLHLKVGDMITAVVSKALAGRIGAAPNSGSQSTIARCGLAGRPTPLTDLALACSHRASGSVPV